MEYVDSLPFRLKSARLNYGMSQAEVGKKLGITAQAISNFERGKGSLSPQNINALCSLYGIDPATLSRQPSAEFNNISTRINDLAASASLPVELRSPIVTLLESILDTIDTATRMYCLTKEGYKIDNAMLEHCRKLELELKNLPLDTEENIERAQAYKRQIEAYRHCETHSQIDLFWNVIGDVHDGLDLATSHFSDQLRFLLENAMEGTADFESHSTSTFNRGFICDEE